METLKAKTHSQLQLLKQKSIESRPSSVLSAEAALKKQIQSVFQTFFVSPRVLFYF